MENRKEVENFIARSVLAICGAGSDRSKYIAEELNNRGYFAVYGGIMKNHNYVTPEDLQNIGTIVFSSIYEKKIFDENAKLKQIVSRNNIQVRVLNITERDKNKAHDENAVDKLRIEIANQLDCVGLKNLGK